MYPEHNQLDPNNPDCRETSAILPTLIPNMDGKNSSVNGYISLIIATMIFLLGLLVTTTSSRPEGTWDGEEKKAPAAICRKVGQLSPQGWWNHRGVGR